jgi:hypothetical protein
MTLPFPKRMRTRPREVSVKQIEFDLGPDHDVSMAVPVPPPIADALVRLMAAAILAVHRTQEAHDDDPGREQ